MTDEGAGRGGRSIEEVALETVRQNVDRLEELRSKYESTVQRYLAELGKWVKVCQALELEAPAEALEALKAVRAKKAPGGRGPGGATFVESPCGLCDRVFGTVQGAATHRTRSHRGEAA